MKLFTDVVVYPLHVTLTVSVRLFLHTFLSATVAVQYCLCRPRICMMIPVNMMDDLLYNGDCNCSVIDLISYLK